jgi:hypothetical protein
MEHHPFQVPQVESRVLKQEEKQLVKKKKHEPRIIAVIERGRPIMASRKKTDLMQGKIIVRDSDTLHIFKRRTIRVTANAIWVQAQPKRTKGGMTFGGGKAHVDLTDALNMYDALSRLKYDKEQDLLLRLSRDQLEPGEKLSQELLHFFYVTHQILVGE